jgi:hypothetical protein
VGIETPAGLAGGNGAMGRGPGIFAAGGLQFVPQLGPAAWALAAGVPVGIIALYFLKLRRRPVRVPSTLLWRRSLEDLHVNSLFQRLRRNLLLFLQLLAVGLAMLALAGPRSEGMQSQGKRIVLAIDESASMGATDVEPSRIEEAKKEARKVVSAMREDDLAMIVAFSDRARVVTNYTSNKDLLLRRIDALKPTQAGTSLREALQLVAGLANPQKQVGEGVVATAVSPPKLFLFTDGGFPDVEGFSLGTIQPQVVVIGPLPPPVEPKPPGSEATDSSPPSDNVAILALESSRDRRNTDRFHVFGRAHNYRAEPVSTRAVLLRRDLDNPKDPGVLVDAVGLEIEPHSDQGFEFDVADPGTGGMEVRLEVEDALPLDDRAYTTFGEARKANVLFVTSGNRFLSDALQTEDTAKLADVTQITPDELKSDAVARELAAGRFDLAIFDRVRPEVNPEANTLYFGIMPPDLADAPTKPVEYPVILDWDFAHPLMQYIRDLGRVAVAKGFAPIETPRGAAELIKSSDGPLAFALPRGAYLDAVVTFPLIEGNEPNTNWPVQYGFPLFVLNSLRSLGHASEAAGGESHAPGETVPLRPDGAVQEIAVTDPTGRVETLKRSPQGQFLVNDASLTGLYTARWPEDGLLPFAVNLFNARESDLAPRGQVPPGVPDDQADKYRIKIGYNPVAETDLEAPTRRDWWWPITLGVLGIVLAEWYVYNRRVYV